MHVLVVHNPEAGLGTHQVDELMEEIADAGHEAVRVSSKEKFDDLSCDLILAAGGDGTVAKAVKYANTTGSALAVLPLGTANNIARSFGVTHTALRLLLQKDALPEGTDKHLRLANAKYHGKNKVFLESVGCGLLSELIGAGKEDREQRRQRYSSTGEELQHRIQILRSLLYESEPKTYSINIDGEDYSGRYLLVEVMNISRTGPGLDFAPNALDEQAELDIVLIKPEDDSALLHYLDDLLDGTAQPRNFTRKRGKCISIKGHSGDFHIDDTRLDDGREIEITLSLTGDKISIVN
jgi:diacylglycerol kinase (ATP)